MFFKLICMNREYAIRPVGFIPQAQFAYSVIVEFELMGRTEVRLGCICLIHGFAPGWLCGFRLSYELQGIDNSVPVQDEFHRPDFIFIHIRIKALLHLVF